MRMTEEDTFIPLWLQISSRQVLIVGLNWLAWIVKNLTQSRLRKCLHEELFRLGLSVGMYIKNCFASINWYEKTDGLFPIAVIEYWWKPISG